MADDLSFNYFLLGGQAIGLGLQQVGANKASSLARRGTRLEQGQVDLRMQQERLLATQQTVEATENLRAIMASQRAIQSARGQMPGVGSAGAVEQGNLRAYMQDERKRALQSNYTQQQLSAQKQLLGLNNATAQSSIYGDLANKSFENIPFNSLIGFTEKEKGHVTTKGVK